MRRRVLNEMFDIRPLAGERLYWAWIAKVKPVLNLRGDYVSSQTLHRFKIVRPRAYPEVRFALRVETPEGTLLFKKIESVVASPVLIQPRTHKILSWPRPIAFRFVLSGAMVVLVVTLGFAGYAAIGLRHDVSLGGTNGAHLLQSGLASATAGNFEDAARSFSQAKDAFSHARTSLDRFPFLLRAALAITPFGGKVDSAQSLLEAGQELSAAAEVIASVFGDAKALAQPNAVLGQQQNFTDVIPRLHERFTIAGEHLDRATELLQHVDPKDFPESVQGDVARLQAGIPAFRQSFGSYRDAADAAFGILGFDHPREYLVLLQNTSELRPTGGFTGNVARVSVAQGRITSFTIHDVYDLDGQIVNHTIPPRPIQDISTAWSLHDANWFRDFPTSAQLSADFFKDVTGVAPSGVFAVTSGVLEDVLGVLGPQTLASGTTFDAATVVDALNRIGLTQRAGETFQTHAIQELRDMLELRLHTMNADLQQKLMERFLSRIAAGDIQAWFLDNAQERVAESLGLAGELVRKPDNDALAVVHANINGFKTDAVIHDTINMEIAVTPQGELIDTATVIRRHTFKNHTDPLYGRVNKDYVRLYVPKGSELLSVEGNTRDTYVPPIDYPRSGFRVAPEVAAVESTSTVHEPEGTEVFEESGRTVFGAWLFVSPGEEVRATFRYKVPGNISFGGDKNIRTILLEKQPGMVATLHVTAKAPNGFEILVPSGEKTPDALLFSGEFVHNEALGFSVVPQ